MNKRGMWIPIVIILLSFLFKSVVIFIIGLAVLAYKIMCAEITSLEHKDKKNHKLNNNATKNENKKKNAIEIIEDKYLSNEFMQLYNDISEEFIAEKEYYDNNSCPYCGTVSDKKINNSKKCSSCKKYIWKRSNYMTKQGYLLADEKIEKYNAFHDKANELYFYEHLLKKRELLLDDDYIKSKRILKDIINDYRYKYVSVRDIVWNFFQNYSIKFEKEAILLFGKMVKMDDMLDKLDVYSKFRRNIFKSNRMLDGMFDICNHNSRYDVALDLLVRVIYNNEVVELLYYGINEFAEIDHTMVYQQCFPYKIIEFLNESNYSLENLKQAYFRTNPILKNTNLLKKEHGWQYVLDSIAWYNKSKK